MYEGDAEGGWGVCEGVVGVVRRCLFFKSLTESILLQGTSARRCHPTHPSVPCTSRRLQDDATLLCSSMNISKFLDGWYGFKVVDDSLFC